MQKVKRLQLTQEEDLAKLHSVLGGCFLRGHASVDWDLTSALERACQQFSVPADGVAERERNALFEFQRRAHHHLSDCPDHDSLLEWLALLQHYGGPTRLVDVTQSIFVAAYFAIEEATSDAAIWALNCGRLTSPGESEGPRTPQSEEIAKANRILAGEENESCEVRLVKPFRLNRRLADQQGAFIMPMSVACPFKDQLSHQLQVNLGSFEDVDIERCETDLMTAHAVQIVIPLDIHSRLLRLLSSANVNAVTLFGGLDGFARSLRTTFRAYE